LIFSLLASSLVLVYFTYNLYLAVILKELSKKQAFAVLRFLLVAIVTTTWLSSSIYQAISFSVFLAAMLTCATSDLATMLLPRFSTIFLAPFFILGSFFDLTFAISPLDSIGGFAFGYGSLMTINWIYKKITNLHGIGAGDMEMLGCIGSFVGLTPVVHIATLSATIPLFFCLIARFFSHKLKDKKTQIPFGAFLALGTYLYLLGHYCFGF
jgi:prepilin signal peptidase PulO-like enzyme (type II secretory pathway)